MAKNDLRKVELALIGPFTYDIEPMKKIEKILIFTAILTLSTGIISCGKDNVKIGRGAPQDEIQKCMKLSEDKKFEEAIDCLEIFKSRFPSTEYSTGAEISIADNYFNKKEYLLAADAYLIFTRMHPLSSQTAYAYYKLGLSYLMETPKSIDRDQQYIGDAIKYLRVAVSAYPDSEYHSEAVESLKDARSRVAARNFYIGRFYYRTGQYRAAIPRFVDVVNKYPESELVPEALYKLVVSAGKLRMVNDSKLFFSKLTMEYPNSEWAPKAEKKVEEYVKKYGKGEAGLLTQERPATGEGENNE